MKSLSATTLVIVGMVLVSNCGKDPVSPPTPDTYLSFKANGTSVNWTFAWADTLQTDNISIHSGTKDTENSNNLLNLWLIPKDTGNYDFESAYLMYFEYFRGPTREDTSGLYWSEFNSSYHGVEANVSISKLENGIVEGTFSGKLQLIKWTGIGEYLTITDGRFRARIRG